MDPATGQVEVSESGKPVLRYNYQEVQPGEVLDKVQPDNRKYARPRSDYIHPLYGLNGEVLTRDWSVDHPHHRGIYWAWPEVDWHGQRGDLHALQRVFARPTGDCRIQNGPGWAEIDARNVWLWEDREPIVAERAIIRAWRTDDHGRRIDLEFHFTAVGDDVALARRGTDQYGGLNIRLAAVRDQQIVFHTDAIGAKGASAWADLSGVFGAGKPSTGLAVLQCARNPDYPGDWVKFPELNWFQPTFPAARTRYVLRRGQSLVLRYRLWIHPGTVTAEACLNEWSAYQNSEH